METTRLVESGTEIRGISCSGTYMIICQSLYYSSYTSKNYLK
jgi:hypothetical protein